MPILSVKCYLLSQMNKNERKMKKEAKTAEQQVEDEMHNESMDLGLTDRLGLSGEKKAKKPKKPKSDEPSATKSPKKGKKKSRHNASHTYMNGDCITNIAHCVHLERSHYGMLGSRFSPFFLVACYATLHPTMSVRWSLGWSPFHFSAFFIFLAHCSCPNALVTFSSIAPAHPQPTAEPT